MHRCQTNAGPLEKPAEKRENGLSRLGESPFWADGLPPCGQLHTEKYHASLLAKEKRAVHHRPVPGHRGAPASAGTRKRCQWAKTGWGFSGFSCWDRAGQEAL